MLVHRWDVARSAPMPPSPGPSSTAKESGADSFGDALYTDGICRPGAEPPAGAGREARVLARLGRS